MEEIFTTPIGPQEMGPLWYARSRMAQANCGIYMWGHNCPAKGRYISLLSRIIDKTSEYTLSIIWYLVEEYKLDEADELVIWTDCGPHYRSYKVLGSCLMLLPEHFAFSAVEYNFGCEHHFKTMLDRYFGLKQQELKAASKNRWIMDTKDCIAVWEEGYERRRSLYSDIADEVFINYWPKSKHLVETATLKRSSAPTAIKTCYSWRAERIRKDRVSNFGRPPNSFMATNLKGIACMVTGNLIDAKYFTPVMTAVDEEEDSVEPTFLEQASLTDSTKVINGWKCSYRNSKPEELTVAKLRPRLQAKARKLTAEMFDGTNEHLRKRPLEARLAAHNRSKENERKRQHAVHMAVKALP